MSKAILISIKPKWVAKILNGKKTIEIRKAMPKCDLPIDVYIYCTKEKETIAINPYGGYATIPNKYKNEYFNGKVVAKFTLNRVEKIRSYLEPEQWYMTSDLGGSGLLRKSCLTFKELDNYLLSGEGYAWHISNLVIFDKPKELSEFKKCQLLWNCDPHDCKTCRHSLSLTKAPQSWCYVEVEE